MAFRSSSAISENSIVFFEGGHDHDGVSSSLIDTEQYSIYDFIVGKTGSNARQIRQQRNFDNLKTVVSNIVINDVLGPSGIRLLPNSVQSVHIAAGAITANELAANIVLVNNVISSNNYVPNTSGWVLYSNGTAEFGAASIRGTLTAGAVVINNNNYWYSNGVFRVGSNSEFMSFNGSDLSVTGDVTTGNLTATGGVIAGWEISGDNLVNGANYAGGMSIGPTSYSGVPGYQVSSPIGNVSSESVLYSGGLITERGNDILECSYSGIVVSDGSNSTIILNNLVDANSVYAQEGLFGSTVYINGYGISGGHYLNVLNAGIRYPSIPGPGQGWGISFDYTNNGGIFYGVIDENPGLILSLDYVNISDRRLKNDIKKISNESIDKIYKLNVYEYLFNDKTPLPHLRGQRRVGLIADEVKSLYPEYVQFEPKEEVCVYKYAEHPDGMSNDEMNEYGGGWEYKFKEDGVYTVPVYEQIKYSEFVPHLIACISSLNQRLTALEEQLGYNS